MSVPRKKSVTRIRSSKPSRLQKLKTSALKVDGASCFWIHQGPILCGLEELYEVVRDGKLTEAQWKHHVTPQRNDFANWIREVFRNKDLAKKLQTAKTQKAFVAVLHTSVTSRK